MKIYVTILSFLCLTFCLGQKPSTLDSLKPTQTINAKQSADSLFSKIGDTVLTQDTATSLNNKSNFKILVVKDSEQSDVWKYIIPVITLILGIGINKLLDYLSERKKIKKSGERWRAEIQCLQEPLSNQILSLEIFRNEHLKENWNIPELDMQIILNCEIFKSLDKAELIKYITQVKRQEYNEAILISNSIHGLISILESNFLLLRKKYDEYIEETHEHTASFNKNLKKLMRAFGNYQVALEIELKKDISSEPNYAPLAKLFDKLVLWNIFNGTDNYDINGLEQDFFQPLAQLTADLRHDQRIYEMVDSISNCLVDIKQIKMDKISFRQSLVSITISYDTASRQIPTVISNL
jgi:hypothetical protein